MGDDADEARGDRRARSRRCRQSCARRCTPAPSALRAALARRTTAKAACRCLRAWPTTSEMRALVGAMGEAGRGVFMLTKGGQTPMPFLESLAARQRPAGDGRGAAAQQHQPATRCSTTSTRSPPPTRAATALLGQVSCCPLSMDFTLHSPYPVEGLASWKPALGLHGRGARGLLAEPGVSRRRARRTGDADHVSPVQRRVGQGPGGRDRDAPTCARYEQRTIAEIAAETAATRST